MILFPHLRREEGLDALAVRSAGLHVVKLIGGALWGTRAWPVRVPYKDFPAPTVRFCFLAKLAHQAAKGSFPSLLVC